jgi:membrane-bound lytic murein transglycosylase B
MTSSTPKYGVLRRLGTIGAAALMTLSAIAPITASPQSFVSELWPDAESRGVKRAIFEAALNDFSPNAKVLELSKKQPEFTQTVGEYMAKRVTAQQISTGQGMAAEWKKTLKAVSERYGVQPEVILSIWGMETNFGSFLGGNNTINALATLTYGGYRPDYFRKELLVALQIASAGHISPHDMIGSWAGAMGQTQFMPSSFVAYAVDHTGDGRADIWNSIPDAMASTGNYLNKHGWRPGETWGYEVKLPSGFNYNLAWSGEKGTLAQWAATGIVRANGKDFPRPSDVARLYLPAGGNGPAFLLLPNFDVIKRYNNSDSYALTVGHLADRILGAGGFVTPWPKDTALSKAQRAEIQQLLTRHGYDVGSPDGVIGPKTRAAIMSFQASAGLVPDGFASGVLLARLKG